MIFVYGNISFLFPGVAAFILFMVFGKVMQRYAPTKWNRTLAWTRRNIFKNNENPEQDSCYVRSATEDVEQGTTQRIFNEEGQH